MSIRLVYKQIIKEEFLEEYLDIMKRILPSVRKQPGCINYQVCQDMSNPLIITCIEEWEKVEDVTAHGSHPDTIELAPKMESFFEKDSGEYSLYNVLV